MEKKKENDGVSFIGKKLQSRRESRSFPRERHPDAASTNQSGKGQERRRIVRIGDTHRRILQVGRSDLRV